MEFEQPSDYLLNDGIDQKNNFDNFNDTLNENIPPLMQNLPETDFITDHTVPDGWSYKGVGGSLRIYSPDGSMFQSRRQLFEGMIASGKHSFEEINNIKYYLQFEGWEESDKIPFGWRIKIRQGQTSRNILLMEQGGKRFGSVSEAVKFVRTYQKYYKESDANMLIRNFLSNNTPNKSINSTTTSSNKWRRNRNEGWKADDNLYPTGWRFKETVRKGGNPSIKLMSPSGDIFPSIRTALVHMVSSKFSEDDISIMRKALVNQKLWLSHPDLPHNWMYQRTNNNILYCDPNGQKHGSKDMALKSLNNPDVIAKLTYFKPPPIPNGSESFDASWKEDNEQERPKVNQEQKQANMEDWKSDELLYPNGWKYKEISRLGKVSHTLLSPSGVRLPNPRAALVFMTKNNFPELDIAIMREALVTQNIWSTHPALPDNWLYRRVGQYNVEYCDPKGRSYRSKDIALNAHALDSKEVIQKLRLFNPPIPLHELNFDESWNIDENVYPAGWRYKDVVMNGRTMFERIVSNDGVVFKGKRAALAYMIKNNFANEDKQKLSFSLEKDGWFSHQSLPEHWLLKKTREGPTFSNENGIKMKNLNAAVKYLAKAGLTSFIENLKDFERPRESKSSNPTQTFKGVTKNIVNDYESWKIDEHVYPTGWKYKDVVINGRKMYERIVSHNGVVFKGKRAALAFMIKNNFTNEDQEKLYFSLEKDGWFSHQSLPMHWLYKKTRQGPMFSNENGIKFKNSIAAVEYLEKAGLTSFLQNLQDFNKYL